MEPPPPLSSYSSYTARKRMFFGGSSSSSYMDPDVVEIAPPKNFRSNSKSLKQKEGVHHEVIEIDIDDDLSDVMVVDEKVGASYKGKTVSDICDSSYNGASYKGKTVSDICGSSYNGQRKESMANHSYAATGVENTGLANGFQSSRSFAPVSYDSSLDGLIYDLTNDDDEYTDIYADDLMDIDEYAMLQSHFDKVDIPPGVEAPLPWLSTVSNSLNSRLQLPPNAVGSTHGIDPASLLCSTEPFQMNKYHFPAGGSSSKIQMNSSSHHASPRASSRWLSSKAGQSKEKAPASSTSAHGAVKVQKKPNAPSSWNCHVNSLKKKSKAMKLPFGAEPFWGSVPYGTHKLIGTSSSTNFSIPTGPTGMDGVNLPSGLHTSMSWLPEPPEFDYDPYGGVYFPFYQEETITLDLDPRSISSKGNVLNVDEVLKKFELFKQFDTVDDHSDHHYARNLLNQPQKRWSKAIQEQWRMLEKDLPDTIFVRVYETRMDLLRAVIVGAEGTPYHDGLFFFDVFFPSCYPMEPPHVYYHSGGLRLNPNLYQSGKVCLSLLNTWSGNKKEMWMPGVSTMLQVLVSIQALILNTKPYFNEPGYESMSGTASGEKKSEQYSEDTFIKSLKTMLYTMRRPPKHFEDFVMGHFCKHAHDILAACKAYMNGAQVGSLVKGGVQDVDQGNKSCSVRFKQNVAVVNNMLVQAFTQVGVKDSEKFLVAEPAPEVRGNKYSAWAPMAATPFM